MQEVGISIYSLPEVDCFRDLVVCIDYFSKWSDLKLIKDKGTSTITSFMRLYISKDELRFRLTIKGGNL